MTNIPDSRWLTVLEKTPWWIFAAIVSAATAILLLYVVGSPIFGQVPTKAAYTIGAIGILALCLLVFKQADRKYKAWSEMKARSVKQSFGHLSNHQKEFLVKVYDGGSRSFELPDGYGDPRWLEELINWNYIKLLPSFIFYDGMPTSYGITEAGWEEIEKVMKLK